jgi:uncharacterized protein YutE (UPF0331/DUF86 family)
MADDVLLNKAASIERCVARAREEYNADPSGFATNFTRQDAAVLNIQRACEAALDMGNHVIRRDQLGITQSSRDVFTLLERAGHIDPATAQAMRKMVGFRNVAVHEYQALVLPIAINIITLHLDDFFKFSQALIKR